MLICMHARLLVRMYACMLSHQISISVFAKNSLIGCLLFPSFLGITFWYMMLATLFWRHGRNMDALSLGHAASTCCMVSLLFLQRRQFASTSTSFILLDFSAFVNISSSCIAHKYPSTCEENVDLFTQALLAVSFFCVRSSRVLIK